jgi:hypothetical protein
MTRPPIDLTAGQPPVEPASRPAMGGFLRRLRLEDALLFGWLVFVEPLIFRPGTTTARSSGPDPFLGLLDLIGLLAFVACLAARSQPGVSSGLIERGQVLYAVGPLFGAFAFTIDDIGEKLGLEGNFDLVPLALGIAVAILVRLFIPPLSSVQRRTLVTPFILVTSRFFGDFLSGFTDMFDLRQLAGGLTNLNDLGGTAFLVAIGTVGVLIFYVMLVFAPRQVADREGTPRTWAVRFLLFLLSLALGQTFSGLLGPG